MVGRQTFWTASIDIKTAEVTALFLLSLFKFPTFRLPTGLLLAGLISAAASTATVAQAPGGASRSASGSLPSLGDNLEMSAGAERRLGDRIAASIYRDPDYIDDAVLSDYMQSIWQPLLAAARARGELNAELEERFAWDLFLIRDRSINAFALPGGYLGVHLGLIGAVASRDEIAAVLGHELSHITQRHISRLITQQARTTPWLIGAMILGMLAASKSPNAAQAAMVGGQAVAAQSQLNFSRDMEREADRVGFGVMTDAGFDSRGVGSMFEKLQQASRINDNGSFPYLRSHPLTTQRIAEAQARVQLALQDPDPRKAGAEEVAQAKVLHAMMAARARVLADPGIDTLRAMVVEAQRQPAPAPVQTAAAHLSAADVRSAGTWYAGALAAAKMRDFLPARNLAEKLKVTTAGNAQATDAAALLSIEIDLLAGTVPSGASSLNISKASSRAAVITQARALLSAGRAQEVADRLSTWVTAHPKDALAWQQLAVAYGNLNQNVRAIRADAEGRAAQLDYTGALDRFKAAQAMIRANPGSADFMDGSIIDTRTRQLDSLVKEQAVQDKLDK
jgi:predicted Zn-dependent protease